MKNFKRLLTICMVVAMLGAVLVLASCSLFSSAVESMAEDLVDAESYTYETENYIYYVDLENLIYVRKYVGDDDDASTRYYYYDEEADKYYKATVSEDDIEKEEISKDDFFETIHARAAVDDIYNYTKLISFFEEEDDAYVYEIETDYGDSTITLYVDDNDALCAEQKYSYEGKTEKQVIKYYDIDSTEIEIPEDVLKADAKKLEK